jgi:RNA polymerase sigma-70 factor (ECF subfamily)
MIRRATIEWDAWPDSETGASDVKSTKESRGDTPAAASGAGFFDWVTRLVHEHRARLVRIARREGLDAEDALDCAQEAFCSFLALPQARALVEEAADSAKLLTVLVRNVARNRRRRHHRARPHVSDELTLDRLPDAGPSADEVVAEAQEYALMLGCMATLTQMQHAIVTLRLVDEAPGEDVGRMLGISAGHVAVHLSRAKQRLRSCYAEAHGASDVRGTASSP